MALLICPNCQHNPPPGSKFCNACGTKLAQAEQQSERRQVTVMFCDLVGSTALSNQLDPEELTELIGKYQAVCKAAILPYEGIIHNYLGDGILALFGYPEAHEYAPQQSIHSGLAIIEGMQKLNKTLQKERGRSLSVRIGIHTGLVIAGELSGKTQLLGETMNLAARLEGIAESNALVVSPVTHQLIEGYFETKSKGSFQLKGIPEPVEVFQVLRQSGAQSRMEAAKGKGFSPFVGRDKELALFSRKWEKAKQGSGNGILIIGEAGIGKSRFTESIKDQLAADAGVDLITYRCSSYRGNSSFHPFIDRLERKELAFQQLESPVSKRMKLKRLLLQSNLEVDKFLPLFADLLSIPLEEEYERPSISPVAQRQQTMEGLLRLLQSKAASQALLIVFEDLHWADPSTMEWMSMFLEALPHHKILTLMTARPHFSVPWPEKEYLSTLQLERLTQDAIVEICAHKTGHKSLPREILRQIIHNTDGNPLFVEELTQNLIESGLLVEGENQFEVKGSVGKITVPTTLQDSLMARLDRIASAKEIAQIGAVIGRNFPEELLRKVVNVDESRLRNDLYQLEAAELIHKIETDHQVNYIFKHALVQETAYNSLLKSRRRQIHQQVAETLESSFSHFEKSQPELLAFHYSEAGFPLQAIPLWEKAGLEAIKRNANLEAVQHIKKGIGLLDAFENVNQRESNELRLLNTLGPAIMMTKAYSDPEAQLVFNRSWELCENLKDLRPKVYALLGLMAFHFIGGNHQKAKEVSEEALDIANRSGNPAYLLLANNALGNAHYISGRFSQAHINYENVSQLYKPEIHDPFSFLGWGHFNINAACYHIWTLHFLGYPDAATAKSKLLFDFIKDKDNHITTFHVYYFTALLYCHRKEWKRSKQLLDHYLPIAKRYGDPFYIGMANLLSDISEANLGDLLALNRAKTNVDKVYEMGVRGVICGQLSLIAGCQIQNRDLPQALATVEKAISIMNSTGELQPKAELLLFKAEILFATNNDPIEAERYFLQALKTGRYQEFKFMELQISTSLARLWHHQGETQKAYDLLHEIYSWFTEGFDTIDLQNAKAMLDELREYKKTKAGS